MTALMISANAGTITARGNINSHNTIYSRDPGERRVELANWVSGLSFSQYQSQAFERYTKGTLLWVLKTSEFVAWLSDGGMLWACGQPGAGKTVFASFIIDYLRNLSLDPKPAVCYIYHRYDTVRSTLQLFEAILKQLILNCPSMNMDHVQAAKVQDQRLTLTEVLLILQTTFNNIPNIFLVIDAFDECFDQPTRHQVLHHLQSFKSVKTLITSRPLPSIESPMRMVLRLIISAHAEDIKTHFRAQKMINPTLARLVSKVSHTDIEGGLVEKADGRFLLAGLHITNLATQTNVTKLLRALETLPQEAAATYEQTLDRIRHQDSNHRQLAFHTLSWILHALRPLTMIELRHALAIENLDRMAEEQDLDEEETIVSSCAGIVIVNKESQTITFLHYTVQEFLQQVQTAPDFLSDVEIALHCIRAISFPDMTSNLRNYPFISYAASVWGLLLRQHEQDDTVFELALSQLTDPLAVRRLMNVLDDACWKTRDATAIHLIAAYGLARTMKAFIARTPAAINEKDLQGFTALIWAAKNGHFVVVKVLLTHPDVDVNSKDKFSSTPLIYAAMKGYLDTVEALLASPNIDVNSKDHQYGRTPLSWTAENGHLEVVKEFLSYPNVGIDPKDHFSCTPLAYAAEKGHLDIVKELLARPNVNVNSKDKFGRTPLSLAAQNGHFDVVKEVLTRPNVDVNSIDISGRTPLSWAERNRHWHVAELLEP